MTDCEEKTETIPPPSLLKPGAGSRPPFVPPMLTSRVVCGSPLSLLIFTEMSSYKIQITTLHYRS